MLGRTVPGTLLTAATTAVFVYGGQQIIAGQMTMGTLVAFMAYHSRLLSPVQSLLGLSASLSSAKVSLSRVLELLDAPIEVTEQPDADAVSAVHRSIEFRDVTLRHDDERFWTMCRSRFPRACFPSLSDQAGARNRTIADLMVRLLDPDAGAVTIDGLDLKRMRLRDLRRTVVLIDQSPIFFTERCTRTLLMRNLLSAV